MFVLFSCLTWSQAKIHVNRGGKYLIHENFGESYQNFWKTSELSNYTGKWVNIKNFLFATTKNAFHAISAVFSEKISFIDQTFVLKYKVKSLGSVNCSGAYLKLFGPNVFDSRMVSNETNYLILFGPDQCGENNRIHFIFKHKNPITGTYEEKHMIDPPQANITAKENVYKLVIYKNNRFRISVNDKPVRIGSLLHDFDPPVNPPKKIEDINDVQPNDWVNDEYIIDETAKKPEDWDETQPEFIPDPSKLKVPDGWLIDEPKYIQNQESKKPDDWDESIFGKWEPELIPNPKCESAPGCGKYEPPLTINPKFVGPWEQPRYRNPLYKGKYVPRMIPNPNYFEDLSPHNFINITGIGFDLWTIDGNVGISDIVISTTEESSELNEEL